VTFYRALGLEFRRHAHEAGPEHYASEGGGVVMEIYPFTAKSLSTVGVRIGFQVAEVDELVARLSPMGVQVVTAPTDSEWGRRAVVKDFERLHR